MIDKDKAPAVPKLDITNCNLVNMVTEHQNAAKSKITMTKLAHARHEIKSFDLISWVWPSILEREKPDIEAE